MDAQDLTRFFYALKVTGYLKTFIKIMSVSLKFHDEFIEERFIEIGASKPSEQIIFMITDKEEENSEVVFLDRSTAIKLSKELRKQIALLD